MAKVYFITGSLGAGKTLCAVDMVRRYLEEGRRVATNVNLNLDYLCGADNKHTRVIRVPDAPEINDLRAIGLGSDKQDDKTHGLLVLDELGTWFNTRDFANKGRLAVIKWMIHMRKRRWDVAFIVQDFGMVDKQARGNIAQFLVTCQSSKQFWLFKPFPKFHTGTVRMTSTKMVSERWIYSGKDVYPAYDTEQLFHTSGDDDDFADSDAEMSEKERNSKAKNGLYCLVPPGYWDKESREVIRARFAKINKYRNRVVVGVVGSLIAGAAYAFAPPDLVPTFTQGEVQTPVDVVPDSVDLPAPAQPEIFRFRDFRISKYTRIGGKISVAISDGTVQLDDRDLLQLGIDLRVRSKSEYLLVDADYNFVSVYW